jgi:uncharacterized membrane-anchored protein
MDLPELGKNGPKFANARERALYGLESALAAASVDKKSVRQDQRLRARLLMVDLESAATEGACKLGKEAAQFIESMPAPAWTYPMPPSQ